MANPFDLGQRILLDRVCGFAERGYIHAPKVRQYSRELFDVLLREARVFLVPSGVRAIHIPGGHAVSWQGEEYPIDLRAPLALGVAAVQDPKSLVLLSDLSNSGATKAFLECYPFPRIDTDNSEMGLLGRVSTSNKLPDMKRYEGEVFVVRWGVIDMESHEKGRLHVFHYAHISKSEGVLNAFEEKLSASEYKTIELNVKMAICQAQGAAVPWKSGLLIRMDPRKVKHQNGPKFLRSGERRRYTLVTNEEVQELPGYPKESTGRAGYVVSKVTKTYKHPRYKNVRGQVLTYDGYVVPSTEPKQWEHGGACFSVVRPEGQP